jgi:hypothetical protein
MPLGYSGRALFNAKGCNSMQKGVIQCKIKFNMFFSIEKHYSKFVPPEQRNVVMKAVD